MDIQRTLRVLEFVKIRDMLASHAVTEMGKEACLQLMPYAFESEASHGLQETEEATVLLSYIGSNPMSWFPDVREQIALAQKGAALSPRALLDIAACMRAARTARESLVRESGNTPIITGIASNLTSILSL